MDYVDAFFALVDARIVETSYCKSHMFPKMEKEQIYGIRMSLMLLST